MLLRAEGLFKAFDNVTVLQDISFDVKPGEVVSLVGKSGAGKTNTRRKSRRQSATSTRVSADSPNMHRSAYTGRMCFPRR